jgi:serine/threonine-protein kinase
VTGEVVGGYRLLRELGARALPAYAALDPKPRAPNLALCVVEQLVREPGVTAEAAAEFLRDAKRLAQLHHPNVVRVRDVVLGASTVLLVSEWFEGEALPEVERAAAEKPLPLPLPVRLRILVDALEGLAALHELRDARHELLHFVHAEVAPRNILVGVDGRSVLAHPLRAPGAAAGHAPAAVGYLAPEALLGDQTMDQRADVFGAGVILWEALMGRRMHPEGEDVGEVVMRLLGGRIEAARPPADAPWAGALAEAARKATSPDPTARFANAGAMLTEVRRALGTRLAAKSAVASVVEATVGAHVRARALALLPTTGVRPPAPTPHLSDDAPPVSVPVEHEPFVDSSAFSAAPPPAKPSLAPASTASAAEVVEVIEVEAQPPPRQPPPFRPREKPAEPARSPATAPLTSAPELSPFQTMTPSKTDLASIALVSTPTPPQAIAGGARAKWALVAACAAGVVVVAWLLAHGSSEGGASTDALAPSSATSAPDTTPAVTPSAAGPRAATAAPSASSPPANAPGPFDLDPAHPPLPVAPKDAPPVTAASHSSPAGPPPPAASSPHPKKRVYDPMGI